MKTTGLILVVVAALSVAVVGTALAASDSPSRATTVSTAQTRLGRIIVDGRGRTLYLFEKDRHGRSSCSGACASYWPPLLANGKPTATHGARQSLLGTTKRANGSRQVTYAGHPIYHFVQDTKRGQTNGEGMKAFGGSWYALTPAGKKIDRDDD